MKHMKAIAAPNTSVWVENGVIVIASPRNPKFFVRLREDKNPRHYRTVMQELEQRAQEQT